MSKDIRIPKGLNIKLKGTAEKTISEISNSDFFTLSPLDFHGITPKMVVKVGDKIQAGDVVFYSKTNEAVKFVSPVSGTIEEIERGEKRRILNVKIKADTEQKAKDFGSMDPLKTDVETLKSRLSEAGCLPYFMQRPYEVIVDPTDTPRDIFISAYNSAPLSADVAYILKGSEKDFQTGIDALSKLTSGKVHLSVDRNEVSFLNEVKNAEIYQVTGKHPAGNVGVQINHIAPVNKGETVWTIAPQDIAIIGRMLNTGKYNATRTFALSGSEVKQPQYYKAMSGVSLESIFKKQVDTEKARFINGNVLSGMQISNNGNLGFYTNEINVIPEGDYYTFFGWMPFTGNQKLSMSRTFFSWLMPNKEYALDTNMNGEERALVMTGEMEKVFPLDIYPMQLLKAILAADIEKMENLGIYEVAPEDFCLVDFVSSSKIEAQDIVRQGLDLMIKEVG